MQIVFHGDFRLADAQALRVLVEEMLRSEERCYVLGDMRDLAAMATEVRRYLGEWGRSDGRHMTAVGLFGANFATRVLVTLMLNAIQLLRRGTIDTFFARDEAEARAWLIERRRVGEPGA